MMNKQLAQKIGNQIPAALAELAAELGMTVTTAGGTFDSGSLTMKVKFEATTEAGAPANFASHARMIRIPEECWGQRVSINGRTIQITGVNLRRRKYPVSGRDVETGGNYKFTADTIRSALALAV